jgi:hypothetical protein
MRVQVYSSYTGLVQITVATPRPENVPSVLFTAASVHEDYCARVRQLLREYKHVGESSLQFAAALRLQTYFPATNDKPFYALRELMPAGTTRDIDSEWQLELMRIRYRFHLALLPAAHQATDEEADAIERHIEYAIRRLFEVNSVAPKVFLPGDSADRGYQSDVDIVCELGEAGARVGIDIPQPA